MNVKALVIVVIPTVYLLITRVGVGAVVVTLARVVFPLTTVIGFGVIVLVTVCVAMTIAVDVSAVEVDVEVMKAEVFDSVSVMVGTSGARLTIGPPSLANLASRSATKAALS